MGQTAKLSASFTNLKVAIGNTIIPALQRIIPVIKSVVQKLTEFFTKMALYSELFFGVKKASDTATTGTDKAVSSTNALADAQENVADATADAKKELMGFDEINKLEINSDNNLGKEEKTDTQLPLATGDFSEANTITDTIKENIDKINDKLSELWKVLEPFRTFVAKGFEDFYNSFLKPLGKWTIGKGLPQLEKIFKNLMKNTDFSKLNKALDNLWKALEPFAETVGEGLLWFLENILSPLASWTIRDVIPAFLNIFSGCIKVLNGILKTFEPLGNWLWDNFLKPLAKWTGEIVTSGLEALANVLGKIGDWVLKHSGATGVIIGMSIAIIGLNTACKLLASGALLTLIGNIGLLVKALGGISVTIGVVIAGIVSWTYVITTLKENWSDIMDVIEQEGGIWGFLSGWIDDCTNTMTKEKSECQNTRFTFAPRSAKS